VARWRHDSPAQTVRLRFNDSLIDSRAWDFDRMDSAMAVHLKGGWLSLWTAR